MNWLAVGELFARSGAEELAARTPRMWPPLVPESFRSALELLRRQRDLGAFLVHVDASMEQCRATGDRFEAGLVGLNAAVFLNHLRAYHRVSPYCRQARKDFAVVTRRRDTPGVDALSCFLDLGSCYFEEGVALKELGSYHRALHAFQKAWAVFDAYHESGAAADSQLYWAVSLRDYGMKKHDRVMVEKALAALNAVRREFICGGCEKGAAKCFLFLAPALLYLERPESIIADYPEALRIWRKEGGALQLTGCRVAYKEAMKQKARLDAGGL